MSIILLLIGRCFQIFVAIMVAAMVWRLFYECFQRRFDWLTFMKSEKGDPRYMDWADVVKRLESGTGCLLQYQGRHCWWLHWHAKRLSRAEAIEERLEDDDCFFTAQPIGYETTFVLRRRFPKVPIYCIRVDYRGSFG